MLLELMPCKNHPLVEEPLVRCARCGETFCPNCIVEIGGSPYCAVCKGEILGDLRSGRPAAGPELASIGRRFGAFFLDGLILTLPLTAVLVTILAMLGLLGADGGLFGADARGKPPDYALILAIEGVIFLVQLVAWILYEGLMLRRNGQTVGKKAMRIRVVSAEGAPLSQGQAFGRAAMRQVLGIVPCLGLVNYLTAFGQQRTCIHDMAARTRVINWGA
jgi:uncharacterized RDD family membrane protein YckC